MASLPPMDLLLSSPLLSSQRLEHLTGWGMAHHADGYVLRPSTLEQVQAIFEKAAHEGVSVTLRGSAQSYGDATLGQEGLHLDMTRMARLLRWEPTTGIIEVEPGFRIMDLWRATLEDGWWPPVVSGTMRPTLGGALGMNIHGKNSYKQGTLGEHVLDLDLLTPQGSIVRCSPQENPELFYAAIGSAGLLGVFTRIRMQLKRITSGLLLVETVSCRSIQDMIDGLEARLGQDYLVGWLDGFASGYRLGRGTLHAARYLHEGEDLVPHKTLNVSFQELSDSIFGIVPRSLLWMGMWMWMHRPGMRIINAVKAWADARAAQKPSYLQGHVAFNFLLDYIPLWKWSYKPGSLLQFQSFLPKETARLAFEAQLQEAQNAGCPPFLCVLKKHRPDPFLMSYNLDGYSLALDFPVRRRLWPRLQNLLRRLVRIVIDHGGRFYFAKDGILHAEEFAQAFPAASLEKLRQLKALHDPQGLLRSDLSTRLQLHPKAPSDKPPSAAPSLGPSSLETKKKAKR